MNFGSVIWFEYFFINFISSIVQYVSQSFISLKMPNLSGFYHRRIFRLRYIAQGPPVFQTPQRPFSRNTIKKKPSPKLLAHWEMERKSVRRSFRYRKAMSWSKRFFPLVVLTTLAENAKSFVRRHFRFMIRKWSSAFRKRKKKRANQKHKCETVKIKNVSPSQGKKCDIRESKPVTVTAASAETSSPVPKINDECTDKKPPNGVLEKPAADEMKKEVQKESVWKKATFNLPPEQMKRNQQNFERRSVIPSRLPQIQLKPSEALKAYEADSDRLSHEPPKQNTVKNVIKKPLPKIQLTTHKKPPLCFSQPKAEECDKSAKISSLHNHQSFIPADSCEKPEVEITRGIFRRIHIKPGDLVAKPTVSTGLKGNANLCEKQNIAPNSPQTATTEPQNNLSSKPKPNGVNIKPLRITLKPRAAIPTTGLLVNHTNLLQNIKIKPQQNGALK